MDAQYKDIIYSNLLSNCHFYCLYSILIGYGVDLVNYPTQGFQVMSVQGGFRWIHEFSSEKTLFTPKITLFHTHTHTKIPKWAPLVRVVQPIWAPSQYTKRRLSVRSLQVSKPRDLYLELSNRFEIWQALRQQCCRCVCQISKRLDNLKYQSRGFETLRDLTKRRLFGYWDGAQIGCTTRTNGAHLEIFVCVCVK